MRALWARDLESVMTQAESWQALAPWKHDCAEGRWDTFEDWVDVPWYFETSARLLVSTKPTAFVKQLARSVEEHKALFDQQLKRKRT